MKEPFLTPLPLVVAHRGDSKHFPENTLEAFSSAMDMGIDVIETDVHLSRDGVPVIWHDPTLERNTDGSGRVEDLALKQLKELDAGFSFTADGGLSHPFRGKGVRMATLEEALDTCPGQRFNVDLKSRDPKLVHAAIQIIRNLKAEERVLIASFHLSNLRMMRRLCPEVLTSLTTFEVLPLLARQKAGLLPRKRPERTLVFQVPVRQWGIEVTTPSFIKDFHALGAVIQVWTINERPEMERLFAMGVDSIMTDDPALVIEVATARGLRRA